MQLPFFQTAVKELSLLQTKWKSILDPVLANSLCLTTVLPNIKLVPGTNVINHLLGRKLLGWIVIRIDGIATLYDTQDLNQHQDLTLMLVCSAGVTVTLEVF